ncbi:MAG: ABC transporter ATP-binding protein [Bifidobacteriaceae bacterium]|nr:ABC transporter ATP-binding protein [Bifidobacteriaceae bacterium]
MLGGLDLAVRSGESVAVAGRSGSGKSTLLSVLGLLRTPHAGRYWVEGKRTDTLSDHEFARLRGEAFGFVFQEYLLMPRHTVFDNVALPLSTGNKRAWKDRGARVRGLLEMVGLSDRIDAVPSQLSGGEKQRVAIARALARSPRVVLADEPSGALDPVTADAVIGVLLEATRSEGVALVVVTHDAAVARRTDRQLVLANGRLWPKGAVSQ